MIGYTVFMKHAEKITKKASEARPILKGVHHAENGDLVVTDSHRLYIARDAQQQKDGSIVNPTTGAKIDGNYPTVGRLIPESEGKMTVAFDVKETLKASKALKSLGMIVDKTPIARLEVDEESTAYLTLENDSIEAHYRIGQADVIVRHNLHFSLQFLVEAIELFKDAGYPEATISTYGKERPFTVKADESLTALLLPIRRVQG